MNFKPAPTLARQLSFACLVLLVATIFIGGEQPGAGALFPPPWDKVVHVLVYGSMGVLAGIAFPRLGLLGVVLVVVGIGATDEFHQAFIPGREAGLPDLMADLAGGLVFLPAVLWLRRSLFPRYSYLFRR